MFSILLRHAGVVALLTMMLGLTLQPLSAQRRFDTEYAKSSEPNIVNLNKNLYTILGDHGSLFDRSRRPYEIGLNWLGLDNIHTMNLLGVSVIDRYVYHNQTGAALATNAAIVTGAPTGTRFIAVENHDGRRNLLDRMGFAAMTRVDFEIACDPQTGLPIKEGLTGSKPNNTSAMHGFKEPSTAARDIDEDRSRLRQANGPLTFSGNTNGSVWDISDKTMHIPSNPVNEREKLDPTRNGEFMVVGINLRRRGPVPLDGQGRQDDYNVPVLTIRIYRQPGLQRTDQDRVHACSGGGHDPVSAGGHAI